MTQEQEQLFLFEFEELKRQVEDLRFQLSRKTGSGSADFKGNIVSPSNVAGTIAAGGISSAGMFAAGVVNLAALAAIIAPTRIVKLSGTITWSGGGVILTSSVSGVLSTDIVMATITVKPTQAAYLVRAVPTTDTITFELSAANTSNDAQISYIIFRATS